MTSRLRTSIASAAALASVSAVVISTPAMGAQSETGTASTASINSLDTPFELLGKKSQWQGAANAGYYDDDDEYDDDDDDDHGYDDDDDDDDGGIGGIGNFVADFLANNQAEVLAVTAMIPVFYLGPVAVGNSLLATAYYNGYAGSAPGIEGVISYVTSQIGVPPADLVQSVVLGLTSLVPQFNIGPVAVGNSLLATAYYGGYNGSATGLPGVISYVTSQLGLQAAPGAAVSVSPAAAVAVPLSVSAPESESAPASVTASRVAAPAAALDRDDTEPSEAVGLATSPADADVSGGPAVQISPATTATGRPAAARGAATGKAGSAHSKARTERSAAKTADSDD